MGEFDSGSGFIHRTAVNCAGANDNVDGIPRLTQGYCTLTDADGDKAILVYKGEKTHGPGAGGGDFQWTGGTGKYVGLRGDNTYDFYTIGQTAQGWVIWKGAWQLP